MTGRGTSVVRGSWGRYYEGPAFNPYNRAVSGYTDFISYDVLADGTLSEFDRTPAFVVPVDADIAHYALDETTVGFEQQLRRDMRFAATGIWRTWDNFISPVNPPGTWTPVAYANRLTGQTMTLYRWFNRTTTDQDYVIKNYAGFPFVSPNWSDTGDGGPHANVQGCHARVDEDLLQPVARSVLVRMVESRGLGR